MEIIDDLSSANLNSDTILTVGAFDGVHRGHQHLIQQMVEEARQEKRLAGLITFHPHPSAVLSPYNPTRYLSTPGEKAGLLERLGLDVLAILPFDQGMAQTSAQDFLGRVRRHLHMVELWVGEDFALGHAREGHVEALRTMGQDLGFTVRVIEPLTWQGQTISSTRIRSLLLKGKVRQAAQLLGRYPSLAGEVVRGSQRGHCLGFPTANLEVREERVIPADGIYAVYARLGKERRQGVANVGVRPSFEVGGARLVEVHILDFDEAIYGCDLVVEFVERLREERRYANVEELKAQIERDVEKARRILGEEKRVIGNEEKVTSKRFEEIEHTADLALRVYGQDMRELFVNAAHGMFSLMAEPPLDGPAREQEVSLEATDYEGLLVDWLNELIYLHEVERETYSRFDFEALSPTRLKAHVAGGLTKSKTKAIKAATFHDLRINETANGFVATIVFDV
jgi:riboflavin kinase/FMN adenylyltransferase